MLKQRLINCIYNYLANSTSIEILIFQQNKSNYRFTFKRYDYWVDLSCTSHIDFKYMLIPIKIVFKNKTIRL